MRKLALVLLLATSALAQTEAPAVLTLPGMDKVDLRKDIRYDGERTFDLYLAPNAKSDLPLVIFLNGVGRPDLKDWGQYTSWPRLVAARGLAAISYQTSGEAVAAQTKALLKYVREHAKELRIDPKRIAIWACSANARLGTAMLAEEHDFRAAVLYYGIMSTPPKASAMPILVARAGLDVASINTSIDHWVMGALLADVPVTLINYPQGVHGFDLRNDTAESREIIRQTLDFLQFHLTTARTAPTEPVSPAALHRLLNDRGPDAVVKRLTELRKTHPNAIVLEENSINALGYALMNERNVPAAVKIFEHAVAVYPDSANAHDSLGDAYEAAGRVADAIRESERAIGLLDKLPEARRAAIRESAEAKLKRLKK
jgi:dienelactone hydrolase